MAGSGKKPNTVFVCTQLAQELAQELGVYLWDVIFEKEGTSWYLRYYIDKDGGVTIDDCETFSRRVDTLLDEADPISQSYYLEVSSPGIERKLTKDWHFKKYAGQQVLVKLIRPVEGVREFVGELLGISDDGNTITILLEENLEMQVSLNETAYVKLYVEF